MNEDKTEALLYVNGYWHIATTAVMQGEQLGRYPKVVWVDRANHVICLVGEEQVVERLHEPTDAIFTAYQMEMNRIKR